MILEYYHLNSEILIARFEEGGISTLFLLRGIEMDFYSPVAWDFEGTLRGFYRVD